MDFLDPKAKRRHSIRLIVGYILMGAVIFMTSSILVFSAYGFDVNRKTGEVIQNGLLFVDSAPDDAQVVLNDQIQKERTNNRFSLPAGEYNLKIQKQDYRNWSRTFNLVGGEVERLMYPMLILNDLKPVELQTTDAAPSFVSQSPDRRWMVTAQAGSLTNFTEYDLNNLSGANDTPAIRPFSVPTTLFTQAEGAHTFELVEWANDNKHFLVKHSFATGFEFVVVSRDQPQTSININQLFQSSPTTVTLRDKKFDQWYLYTQEGGVLQQSNAKKETTEVAKQVLGYKSHDDNTILYATPNSFDATKVDIIVKEGSDKRTIRSVAAGAISLDIARYDGNWHIVIGSGADQKTYVYVDPVEILKSGKQIAPITILKNNGQITWQSFSKNTRFIVAQSGQHFEVYDAEYQQTFAFDMDKPLDAGAKVDWIDGHRLGFRSNGQANLVDFDGSNKQTLVAANPVAPLIFDRDYTVFYSLDGSKAQAGKTALTATQLRLKADK